MQNRNTRLTKLAGQFSFVAKTLGTVAKQRDQYGIVFFPVKTPAKYKHALQAAADQLIKDGVLSSYHILRNGFTYCMPTTAGDRNGQA